MGGRHQGLRGRHRREHLRDELVDALPHHALDGRVGHRALLLLPLLPGKQFNRHLGARVGLSNNLSAKNYKFSHFSNP